MVSEMARYVVYDGDGSINEPSADRGNSRDLVVFKMAEACHACGREIKRMT